MLNRILLYLIVHIIIKIEEINEKYKKIKEVLNCELPILHKNKGDYTGSYREYYKNETCDLIKKYFKYEIDAFGYIF